MSGAWLVSTLLIVRVVLRKVNSARSSGLNARMGVWCICVCQSMKAVTAVGRESEPNHTLREEVAGTTKRQYTTLCAA